MSNDTLKIEKGIPMPSRNGGALYREMAVGDSIVIKKNSRSITAFWGVRTGFKFTTRAIDKESVRVWRTA